MDSKQLIDSLTSHISLYHSSIPKQLPQNQNPRTSIIRWFTSLSIHQRQSSLTVVDSNFINIILQMQTKLRQHGHGLFIILPDLPSTTQPKLPCLCFRKSKGLLSRVSQSNQSKLKIHEAVRLFGSEDETRVDTMTVCEELVGNVDRFVEVMDGVSDCGFLRGEESISGADWEELRWLKERGYYSVEAFTVNKLELALRLAWLNSNGKKKSGNKLKEKANVAGIAANVFWRKKGCLDWWAALEHDMRLKVFRTVLGKSAKSLTRDILKGECTVLTGDKCLFNTGEKQPPSHDSTSSFQRVILADARSFPSILPASTSRPPISLSSIFASLFVLQEICTMTLSFQSSMLEMDNVFFSTMDSFHTVSDYILRKFRGSVMVVSSDCIRHELLAEENVKSPLNKVGDKLSTGSRKGKGKSRTAKKLKSATKSSRPNHTLEKSSQDCKCGFACKEARKQKANEFICTPNGEDAHKETSMPIVELDYAKGLVDGKAQAIGKKSRKKSSKTKFLSVSKLSIPGGAESGCTQTATESVSLQLDSAKTDLFSCDSPVCDLKNNISIGNDGLTKTFSKNSICKSNMKDDTKMARNCEVGSMVCSVGSGHDLSCCESSNKMARNCHGGSVDSAVGSSHDLGCCESSKEDASVCSLSSGTMLPVTLVSELNNNVICHTELTRKNTDHLADALPPAVSLPMLKTVDSNGGSTPFQRHDVGSSYAHWPRGSLGSTSYEWPTVARYNIPFVNSQHLPAATDRLHLDVGCNWRNQLHQSFVSTRHQTLGPSIEGGRNHVMPRTLPVSLDWPPMVRTASRLTGSIACNYDSGFIPRIQSTYQQGRRPHRLHPNGTLSDEERKYPGESMDSCDFMNTAEVADCERHWVSDEEFEVHALSERDYNQYFGGGVMYWNSTDHAGTGCSRPPSLSSDDSSWAWHEADLNRAIDDMVGIPSTYGSNGLTSPPSGSFCSPFDPMGPGHQSVGYIIPGSDMTGKANHPSSNQTDGIPEEKVSGSFTDSTVSVGERQNGDLHPYPILRPIIIPNVSRKGSRSEFKVSHDHRSPCVSISRRDQPRIKRPPSPVVLCVPRAPGPPPFSPVLESRKRRGFPTVRSGSSSPRHWGMRSWYHDGNNPEDAGFRVDGAEVVWPSWRSKGLSVTSMIQPLQGALLQDHLIAISQLALDQEHPDAAFPLQPPELLNCPSRKASLPLMHSLLHDEIDSFCKQVAAKNINMKPCINWAVKRVARSLQVLWPRSRTNIFGSNATGLSLPTSDVDLVVCLPPVRNLEPIKEAGILEGRNGIKETCLQHAARYLANQEWVKNDSLKTVENTAIPIIMLVVEVPQDVAYSGSTSNEHTPAIKSTQTNGEESSSDHSDVVLDDHSWKLCSDIKKEEGVGVASVRLDISFKSPSHTGLQTTELVRELTEQFPAAIPLALVLKQFLADRSLDHSYSGGLSSYCLVLLITRFLQHEHHLGRPINQNLGSLLIDFLYFFGNVFDPRQMRVSIQGSGVYVNRERGHSIDPIHIDDPLFPTNNVGKNCFRIHQCIKAFAEAYSTLESELTNLSCSGDPSSSSYSLLQKIIPSIDHS